MKKLIYDSISGKTTEIVDETTPVQINDNWHNLNKPIRVILPLECLRLLNIKKEFNEAVNWVCSYFKSAELEKYEVDNGLYIYLNEIYPEHQALLESNNAIIEKL